MQVGLMQIYFTAQAQLIDTLLSAGGPTAWATSYAMTKLLQVRMILKGMAQQVEAWKDNPHAQLVYQQGMAAGDEFLIGPGASKKGQMLAPAAQAFTMIHEGALQALIQARVDPLAAGIYKLDEHWQHKEAFRAGNLEAIGQAYATGMTRQQASKRVLQVLQEKGLFAYTDVRGRKWAPEDYAEMIARTLPREVYQLGHHNRLIELDRDLVKVTGHRNPCPACRGWEGRVLSVSGKTTGYPTLADARATGYNHPRCIHTEVTYFGDVEDRKPSQRFKEVDAVLDGQKRSPSMTTKLKQLVRKPPAQPKYDWPANTLITPQRLLFSKDPAWTAYEEMSGKDIIAHAKAKGVKGVNNANTKATNVEKLLAAGVLPPGYDADQAPVLKPVAELSHTEAVGLAKESGIKGVWDTTPTAKVQAKLQSAGIQGAPVGKHEFMSKKALIEVGKAAGKPGYNNTKSRDEIVALLKKDGLWDVVDVPAVKADVPPPSVPPPVPAKAIPVSELSQDELIAMCDNLGLQPKLWPWQTKPSKTELVATLEQAGVGKVLAPPKLQTAAEPLGAPAVPVPGTAVATQTPVADVATAPTAPTETETTFMYGHLKFPKPPKGGGAGQTLDFALASDVKVTALAYGLDTIKYNTKSAQLTQLKKLGVTAVPTDWLLGVKKQITSAAKANLFPKYDLDDLTHLQLAHLIKYRYNEVPANSKGAMMAQLQALGTCSVDVATYQTLQTVFPGAGVAVGAGPVKLKPSAPPKKAPAAVPVTSPATTNFVTASLPNPGLADAPTSTMVGALSPLGKGLSAKTQTKGKLTYHGPNVSGWNWAGKKDGAPKFQALTLQHGKPVAVTSYEMEQHLSARFPIPSSYQIRVCETMDEFIQALPDEHKQSAAGIQGFTNATSKTVYLRPAKFASFTDEVTWWHAAAHETVHAYHMETVGKAPTDLDEALTELLTKKMLMHGGFIGAVPDEVASVIVSAGTTTGMVGHEWQPPYTKEVQTLAWLAQSHVLVNTPSDAMFHPAGAMTHASSLLLSAPHEKKTDMLKMQLESALILCRHVQADLAADPPKEKTFTPEVLGKLKIHLGQALRNIDLGKDVSIGELHNGLYTLMHEALRVPPKLTAAGWNAVEYHNALTTLTILGGSGADDVHHSVAATAASWKGKVGPGCPAFPDGSLQGHVLKYGGFAESAAALGSDLHSPLHAATVLTYSPLTEPAQITKEELAKLKGAGLKQLTEVTVGITTTSPDASTHSAVTSANEHTVWAAKLSRPGAREEATRLDQIEIPKDQRLKVSALKVSKNDPSVIAPHLPAKQGSKDAVATDQLTVGDVWCVGKALGLPVSFKATPFDNVKVLQDAGITHVAMSGVTQARNIMFEAMRAQNVGTVASRRFAPLLRPPQSVLKKHTGPKRKVEKGMAFEGRAGYEAYTGSAYGTMKQYMRTGVGHLVTREGVHGMLDTFDQFEKFEGTIHRGFGVKADVFHQIFPDVGATVQLSSFTSFSTSQSVASRFAREIRGGYAVHLTVRNSRSGVYVSPISSVGTIESEVLMPPGAKFRVKSIKVVEGTTGKSKQARRFDDEVSHVYVELEEITTDDDLYAGDIIWDTDGEITL